MSIEITPAMVKLSQQFIERLFDKTFQRGNSDLIIESLKIIKKIADVGYSPGFITILPYIHRMITTNGWAVLVVPIVSLFSKHPEMKEHLSGSKILRELQFIKDESVQADIEIIRSNIPF
ncbi:hypothetical protein TVAG_380230 [Trichomonas vaginalis G3]|uniref:Uncharacterized protein n=1 Tax=Trichomonas vaginalis (strain ATCC PRA-98 / G3) TaxID=412133 RepID=A2DXG1_TRIV3|nr:protein kinase protein [Trichomonas vaginalis G3]EAY14913.1 hypothetical protein TVAG_380230 [Trichomonas vaginalis G3]KAI5485419.1 protein kinase protein [Trichomonas vaginalis G3]|eukprot:XP_001327136.1 hypothetical protein [Trichomonas vaginalis G3]